MTRSLLLAVGVAGSFLFSLVLSSKVLAGDVDSVLSVPDLEAFWTFGEASGARQSLGGSETHSLNVGGGSVARISGGPFSGYSANFNGTSDYLTIPGASTSSLNISGADAQVTVVAWIERNDSNTGFIGGIWKEDNGGPARQYGLFVDLPLYGGAGNVAGHVSFTGGPTPGYPYSRDYSANTTRVFNNTWTTVAFTFDGEYAKSFIDAKFEARPTFTDNQGATYAKNPYYFPDGLGDNGGDFTVGAVRLTGQMGNYYGGKIGGLAVFSRALNSRELFQLHAASLEAGDSAVQYSFRHASGTNQSPSALAWSAYDGATIDSSTSTSRWVVSSAAGDDGTTGFLAKSTLGQQGIAWTDSIPAVDIAAIDTIEFSLNNQFASDSVRLAFKLDGIWYVSAESFSVSDNDGTATNWATESERMTFNWDLDANSWHLLDFRPGTALDVGSLLTADLESGFLEAFGFYQPANSGVIRIDKIDFGVDLAAVPESGTVELVMIGVFLLFRRKGRSASSC